MASSSPLLKELLQSAGAGSGALGAHLVPSRCRLPRPARRCRREEPLAATWSRLGRGRCRGEGGSRAAGRDGSARSALLGSGMGMTGLLPPFPSQQRQTSALHWEALPAGWCCSRPGVPVEGSPCLPRVVCSQQPCSLPAGGVCRRRSWNRADSLSTVTLNSGLSLC